MTEFIVEQYYNYIGYESQKKKKNVSHSVESKIQITIFLTNDHFTEMAEGDIKLLQLVNKNHFLIVCFTILTTWREKREIYFSNPRASNQLV